MPFQLFTHAEVVSILRLSEGADLAGKHEGHAGRKHVSIRNDDLAARQEQPPRKGGGLALFTSFLRFDDQAAALLAVLNEPAQNDALEAFRQTTRPGGELVIEHAAISVPIPMRYAIGGGTQTFPCTQFTLWGRKELSRPRGLHVVSFFGTMGKMYGEP